MLWLGPVAENRPPGAVDIVVEGPNSDEEAVEVPVLLPKIELFVAALWAVSPDGANKLVLLFAGCSVFAPPPEKRPPALGAAAAEDWPNSDMVDSGLSAGRIVDGIGCSCLRNRVQNYEARSRYIIISIGICRVDDELATPDFPHST